MAPGVQDANDDVCSVGSERLDRIGGGDDGIGGVDAEGRQRGR